MHRFFGQHIRICKKCKRHDRKNESGHIRLHKEEHGQEVHERDKAEKIQLFLKQHDDGDKIDDVGVDNDFFPSGKQINGGSVNFCGNEDFERRPLHGRKCFIFHKNKEIPIPEIIKGKHGSQRKRDEEVREKFPDTLVKRHFAHTHTEEVIEGNAGKKDDTLGFGQLGKASGYGREKEIFLEKE